MRSGGLSMASWLTATKPYAASGRYTQRMSNYCESCPFDPGKRAGDDACPITTF